MSAQTLQGRVKELLFLFYFRTIYQVQLIRQRRYWAQQYPSWMRCTRDHSVKAMFWTSTTNFRNLCVILELNCKRWKPVFHLGESRARPWTSGGTPSSLDWANLGHISLGQHHCCGRLLLTWVPTLEEKLTSSRCHTGGSGSGCGNRTSWDEEFMNYEHWATWMPRSWCWTSRWHGCSQEGSVGRGETRCLASFPLPPQTLERSRGRRFLCYLPVAGILKFLGSN